MTGVATMAVEEPSTEQTKQQESKPKKKVSFHADTKGYDEETTVDETMEEEEEEEEEQEEDNLDRCSFRTRRNIWNQRASQQSATEAPSSPKPSSLSLPSRPTSPTTPKMLMSDADRAGGAPTSSQQDSNDNKEPIRDGAFRDSCNFDSFHQTKEFWEEAAKTKTPAGIHPETAVNGLQYRPNLQGDDLPPSTLFPPKLVVDDDDKQKEKPKEEDEAEATPEKEMGESKETAEEDDLRSTKEPDTVDTEKELNDDSSDEGTEAILKTDCVSLQDTDEHSPTPTTIPKSPSFVVAPILSHRDASSYSVDQLLLKSITNGGPVLARSSFRSLLLKKWQPAYWIRAGTSSLYVFRSRDDFEEWLYNSGRQTSKQREYLLKLRLDFADSFRQSKNLRGYRLTPLKQKSYEKRGPLFQFKMEKLSDSGVSVVVAFAATDKAPVEMLRQELEDCLAQCPNGGLLPMSDGDWVSS